MLDQLTTAGGSHALRIVLLSGNTKRPSKSRALAGRIGDRLAAIEPMELLALDLQDAGRALGSAYSREELSVEAEFVVASIEQADALVVVTPIHNGSYPGLFKHLVDFTARGALAGKPVLLGASGASRHHAMVIETQLAPLFGHLRAQICAHSVFEADEASSIDTAVSGDLDVRIGRAVEQFELLLSLTTPAMRLRNHLR